MQLLSPDLVKTFLATEKFDLQPTQERLCFPIIKRICIKMEMGLQFENINADESLLINGHHRYICSLLLQKHLGRNNWKSPSRITTFRWAEIEIDTNDWESIEIIHRHNARDAARNNLDVEVLKRLSFTD